MQAFRFVVAVVLALATVWGVAMVFLSLGKMVPQVERIGR